MMSFARLGNDLYFGKRSFKIVENRKRWLVVAGTFVLAALVVLGVRGLTLGVEFSGGSEFRAENVSTTDASLATDVLSAAGISDIPRVSTIGTDTLRIQTSVADSTKIEELRVALGDAYGASTVSSTFIGPAWGQDVTRSALWGMAIFLPLVGLGMALYFRTWTMSLGALTALLHDMIVTVGVYALVGFEVTPASVIGFLTILGYSLYDTVVVFDKVRENTKNHFDQDRITYVEASDLAVNQTMVRSINTSMTGLLPVGAILFVGATGLGAGTLRDIALALFVGMFVSTFSSVFVAAPAEAELRTRTATYRKHDEHVVALRDSGRDIVAVDSVSAAALGATVAAGTHKGHAAQPRKKSRRNR